MEESGKKKGERRVLGAIRIKVDY